MTKPVDITHNGRVVGTVRHDPSYVGHWRGEAWITTSIHTGGEQVHQTEYDAVRWVRNPDQSADARRIESAAAAGRVNARLVELAAEEENWNEAIDWLLNSRHTGDPDIQTAFWGIADGKFTREYADGGVFTEEDRRLS